MGRRRLCTAEVARERECASGVYSDTEGVREYAERLKRRVDEELASGDPWGELHGG